MARARFSAVAVLMRAVVQRVTEANLHGLCLSRALMLYFMLCSRRAAGECHQARPRGAGRHLSRRHPRFHCDSLKRSMQSIREWRDGLYGVVFYSFDHVIFTKEETGALFVLFCFSF